MATMASMASMASMACRNRNQSSLRPTSSHDPRCLRLSWWDRLSDTNSSNTMGLGTKHKQAMTSLLKSHEQSHGSSFVLELWRSLYNKTCQLAVFSPSCASCPRTEHPAAPVASRPTRSLAAALEHIVTWCCSNMCAALGCLAMHHSSTINVVWVTVIERFEIQVSTVMSTTHHEWAKIAVLIMSAAGRVPTFVDFSGATQIASICAGVATGLTRFDRTPLNFFNANGEKRK